MKKFVNALAVLALVGCTDPVDKAAKQNIFSPENPPKVVEARKEVLASDKLGEDARTARRVLGMSGAELTERLGPHRYRADVAFEWSIDGGRVALKEKRTLLAGPGGVAGDFHGVSENTRDQGMEVLRVNGDVFARSRYGKFRQRRRDRGMAERTREELYGAVRDVDQLFGGRLQLTPSGTATHEGRTVWKYKVGLAPEVELASAGALPPIVEAKGGVDLSTRTRRLFAEARQPKSLTGELLVDEQEGVVLAAKLDGRLSVPEREGTKPAELKLTVDAAITAIGKEQKLEAPKEFLPDQDKPQGIEDALEKFGVASARKAAEQDKAGEPPDEPEDE